MLLEGESVPRRSRDKQAEIDSLTERLYSMQDIRAMVAVERVAVLGGKRTACKSLKISFHTLQKYLKYAKENGLETRSAGY